MSRPWLSVPSGKLQLPPSSQAGGFDASSRLKEARSNGSCGARHCPGAASAGNSALVAELSSTNADALPFDPQPRVDDVIEQVDDEVDHDEEEPDQHQIRGH